MIERLMNMGSLYGRPECSKLSEKIIRLKQQLYTQLSPQGKEQLEQLTDPYLEQSAALLESSFVDGFCSAVGLMQGYLKYTTINQQQPPGP